MTGELQTTNRFANVSAGRRRGEAALIPNHSETVKRLAYSALVLTGAILIGIYFDSLKIGLAPLISNRILLLVIVDIYIFVSFFALLTGLREHSVISTLLLLMSLVLLGNNLGLLFALGALCPLQLRS